MHALIVRPLWPVCYTRVCAISHHNRRIPHRTFHCSPRLSRSAPTDPAQETGHGDAKSSGAAIPPGQGSGADVSPVAEHASNAIPGIAEGGKDFRGNGQEGGASAKNYGIQWRRQERSKKSLKAGTQGSTFEIPKWFLQRNVRLREDLAPQRNEDLMRTISRMSSRLGDVDGSMATARSPILEQEGNLAPIGPFQTSPNRTIGSGNSGNAFLALPMFMEIYATIDACLSLSKDEFFSLPAAKANVALYCPVDGGTPFLDSVVENIAADLNADLVQLDAQDFAELGADFVRQSIRTLGFDAYTEREDPPAEEDEEDEDSWENEESTPPRGISFSLPKHITLFEDKSSRLNRFLSRAKEIRPDGDWFNKLESEESEGNSKKQSTQRSTLPQRLRVLLNAVIDAVRLKRDLSEGPTPIQASRTQQAVDESSQKDRFLAQTVMEEADRKRTIICISDFMEISSTPLGRRIVQFMASLVRSRRREGQEIIIVGTSATSDLAEGGMKESQKELDEESDGSLYRTILVTPMTKSGSNAQALWESAKDHRVASINLRHLQSMISHLSPDPAPFDHVNEPLMLDSAEVASYGLNKKILSLEEVHRLAVLTIGMHRSRDPVSRLTTVDVRSSLKVLAESNTWRNSWDPVALDNVASQNAAIAGQFESSVPQLAPANDGPNLEKLKEKCDRHEKKLLTGIIRPQDIHTTFNQIHAPSVTIDALRTLTSLSLLRPEAFKYGVLKLESIPGLLLYGPPGTGKTLLAKAVAKESGATVLSISGSEVNDMFVGESEKNVRAIFSLARKLSPCVVFIDEADSLFGTRAMSRSRPSHRDTINQFLREWDGMNDMSVFLMVATNRPFDLDDAVLRRLPRRLLIDLPTEKDREQILDIHLRDESLDSAVSIPELATQTPFYSGSDLKNLAVAAALACVREENGTAAAATASGQPNYKHAEKRTLSRRHFDQALGEISASISEDMSSLTAIRKFDEQFGDRKGRRKKNSLGFGQEQIHSDMVRVRA